MKNNIKSSFLKAKMFMRFKMSDRKKVPIIALVTFVRLVIYKNFSEDILHIFVCGLPYWTWYNHQSLSKKFSV